MKNIGLARYRAATALPLSAAMICAALCGDAAAEAAKAPVSVSARVESMRPEHRAASLVGMSELYPTRRIARQGPVHQFGVRSGDVGAITYEIEGTTHRFDELFERNHTAGMVVLHHGRIVYERYQAGADAGTHFHSFSVAKSITATLVGLALGAGHIASLDDPIVKYLPELRGSGYEGATIKHALQMSSGVKFSENYAAPDSDISLFGKRVLILNEVSAPDMLKTYPRVAPPGTTFNYSTAETTLLTWLVTAATGRSASKFLEERLWTQIGAENDASWVLDRAYGMEIGGIGFNATVRDYAKIGQLMLDDGVWQGKRLLPAGWVQKATTPDGAQVQYGKLPWGEPEGYGYQWWLIPGTDHAYCAEGVFGQMIYVNPALHPVVAKSSVWPTTWDQKLKAEAWTAFRALGAQLKE
jgi:CubicO group peptidase (beta-lactamase class C family)